jgi:hypothetical protein
MMNRVPMKIEKLVTLRGSAGLERGMNKQMIIGGLLAVTGAMLLSAPKAGAAVNISIGVGVAPPVVVYVPVSPRAYAHRPVYYAPPRVVYREVHRTKPAPPHHGGSHHRR